MKAPRSVCKAFVVTIIAAPLSVSGNNGEGLDEGKAFAGKQGGVAVDGSMVHELPDGGGDVSTQRRLFQGGQGDPVGPGMNKIGTCSSQDDPECSAINFMNQDPTPEYPMSENDPMLKRAEAIQNNAEQIAGPDMASEAACIEQTVTTPGKITEERCEVFRHGNQNMCDVERIVEVERNVSYQCRDGYTMDTKTCTKKRVVEVQPGGIQGCSPGDLLFTFWAAGETVEFVCSANGYNIHAKIRKSSGRDGNTTKIYSSDLGGGFLYGRNSSGSGRPKSCHKTNVKGSYREVCDSAKLVISTVQSSCDMSTCYVHISAHHHLSGAGTLAFKEFSRNVSYKYDRAPGYIRNEYWQDNCASADAIAPN